MKLVFELDIHHTDAQYVQQLVRRQVYKSKALHLLLCPDIEDIETSSLDFCHEGTGAEAGVVVGVEIVEE